MDFQYKQIDKEVRRPIIKVTLQLGDKHFISEALVDSGADLCYFDAEFTKILKIDLKSGKKDSVRGIVEGQVVDFYIHKIDLIVGGWKNTIEVGFMENFPTEAGASGLLGQKGFFDNFKVSFDYPKGKVEIKSFNHV